MKVLLILGDGMRPDALTDLPAAKAMMARSSYTLAARAAMPSVTLPCHMSLCHSVDPERHGTTTNTYAPQVRPIPGQFEQLKAAGKRSAVFYDWEELRDISRPDSLALSLFARLDDFGGVACNEYLTDEAIRYIRERDPDFVFLHLGYTDHAGHDHGWMSPEYHEAVAQTWEMVDRIVAEVESRTDGQWTVLITADHGGHDRIHGTDLDEDMLIPLFLLGKDFAAGKELSNITIKDIAPTIADLMGVHKPAQWEGNSLV